MKHLNLKKIEKMFIIFLFTMIMLTCTTCYADKIVNTDNFEPSTTSSNTINDAAGKIIGYIQIIGSVVAILTIIIIGIKYMVASADRKAEYKKQAIPYMIGATLLFAGTNILQIIYDIVNNL